MNDLIYHWKDQNPVQMVANLSLPGGFKMDGFNNKNCDVKTATGTVVRLSSTAGIVLFITPNILDMKHILDTLLPKRNNVEKVLPFWSIPRCRMTARHR